MTIADTLYDAANDIRDYIEDGMEPYGELEDEIIGVAKMMEALREKIDALGSTTSSLCEREFRKSQAQEETTQLKPE